MTRSIRHFLLAAGVLAGFTLPAPLRAEVKEVNLSQQFGVSFLPLMVMENQKLIEKQAASRGIADLKANWTKMAGPSVMTDALLSGSLQYSAQGAPSVGLLWDKTKGQIKGVSGICDYPLTLMTRNKDAKSVKDLTDKDRIAVPSVKVSTQAIMLQMLAEREFGPGQHYKLDPLTVGLAHPDAMAAVLNPAGEVNAHFATSPFTEIELKAGLRPLITSYDILGGQATALVLMTADKFRTENPKTHESVLAALDEAIQWIYADKPRAAALYLQMTGDRKSTVEETLAGINVPGFEYTRTPHKVFKTVEFMSRIGSVKSKPASWKDLFFSEAHSFNGD